MTTNRNSQQPPDDFTGIWKFESPDGSYREISYLSGVQTGPARIVLRNGITQRKYELLDGKFHGTMSVYSSSRQLLDQSEFENGTGTYHIFTTDGHLGWEIPLVKGKKHGIVRRLNNGRWEEQEWRAGHPVE